MYAHMTADLIGIVALGIGALLVGTAGLLSRQASPLLQASPLALAALATAAARFGNTSWAWLLPASLGILYALLLVVRTSVAEGLIAALRWKQLGWVVVLGAGPLFAMLWTDALMPYLEPWQLTPAYLEARKPVQLRRAPLTAVTDSGNVIKLYQPAEVIDKAKLREHDLELTDGFRRFLIRTDGPGIDSNCHGWTFTGGKFWVRTRDIEQVLSENGYKVVDAPQADDLVIYRDPSGEIIHSGIVRKLAYESALVESKWGKAGCYFHFAEHSCYGLLFSYYRSPRPGHLLDLIESPPMPQERPAPRQHFGLIDNQ